MKLQSNGSFLEVSTSHGIFHMAAQVKLVNLTIAYVVLGLIAIIKWKLIKKFLKGKSNGM